MNAASSDARNSAMFAISLGLPIRPIGWNSESTLYCKEEEKSNRVVPAWYRLGTTWGTTLYRLVPLGTQLVVPWSRKS